MNSELLLNISVPTQNISRYLCVVSPSGICAIHVEVREERQQQFSLMWVLAEVTFENVTFYDRHALNLPQHFGLAQS